MESRQQYLFKNRSKANDEEGPMLGLGGKKQAMICLSFPMGEIMKIFFRR